MRGETLELLSANRVVTVRFTQKLIKQAAIHGRLDVIKWVVKHGASTWGSSILATAAINGHLHIVQWLQSRVNHTCSPDTMDLVASRGHVHILEWMDTRWSSDRCTVRAMALVAKSDRVKAVAWLHRNHSEWDGAEALQAAIRNGSPLSTKYLVDEKLATCSYAAAVRDALLDARKSTAKTESILLLIEYAGAAGSRYRQLYWIVPFDMVLRLSWIDCVYISRWTLKLAEI